MLLDLSGQNLLGKDVTSQELDVAVFQFLEMERSKGRCVRNKDLQEKALEIADTLGLSAFKASPQWLCSWKKRWNIGFRRGTSCAQRVPADFQEQLHHFPLHCCLTEASSQHQPTPDLEHGPNHVQVCYKIGNGKLNILWFLSMLAGLILSLGPPTMCVVQQQSELPAVGWSRKGLLLPCASQQQERNYPHL